jgi:hypothetical protein
MDPSMMGPPPGGDPSADKDPAVPLSALKDFTTGIIEAVKGKRTADPKDPNSVAPDPAAGNPNLPPGIQNLGGAPSDSPTPLPGMAPGAGAPPPPGAPPMGGAPKTGAAAENIARILENIRKDRGYR